MCAEEASEKYWELLAEERRKALGIALEENKEVWELEMWNIENRQSTFRK